MITYIKNEWKVLAGFVGYDSTQNAIIVSFRGTVSTSITDWVTNLAFTKTKPWSEYPDAKVHDGFHGSWENLEDDVMSAISSIRATHPTTTVQLTGHSLGAAMAINAALDIKLKYGLDTSYLDFGRPRAGNLAFTQALLSEGITGFRVTHHKDIVPHAPPEAFGFYHAPMEVYYPGSGSDSYHMCDGSGEDPECSNSCTTSLTCTSIGDHLEYMGFTVGSDNCASSDSAVMV
jgi:predicted lipase